MGLSPYVYNSRSLSLLGDSIAALRISRGLTQSEAAQRAGVSRQWLNAAESGKTRGLEVGKLFELLDSLDASLLIRDDLNHVGQIDE